MKMQYMVRKPPWNPYIRALSWPAVNLSRLSLSTRLTLLALATLCPIAGLTVFSYVQHQSERRDTAIEDARAYSQSVATSIDNFAQDLESLTFAAGLAIGGQSAPINQANNGPYLQSLLSQNETFKAIFLTDLDGRVLATASGKDEGLDLSSRPYVAALISGADEVWSGALDGLQSGQVTVAFGRVVRDQGGEPRAYLVAAFYPAVLSARLPASPDGHVVLLDQRGKLLYSSTDPRLENSRRDLSSEASVQTVLTGADVTFRSQTTPFDSDKRFGALVPIPTMNWSLGFTRSQADLEGSLRNSLLRDLGVLALISVASVGALLLVARQISRPLAVLSRNVAAMKEGTQLAMPRFANDPDVARLQQGFVDMRAAVEHRERALADQAALLDTLEHAGALLASNLDFEKTVQAVTDAGVGVTEAAFGAFFYNVQDEDGESYQLFSLSGADRSQFNFGMPRNTDVFGPTFRGEGVIRLGDVLKDHRYGNNAPHFGMPEGHLPVRSYLASPVVSRDGNVLGGLFFGHPQPDMFSERHEELVKGIAAWAAIALDNARQYQDSQDKQRDLIEANRARDEFLGLVSHELRTPITIILGGASHLLEYGDRMEAEARAAVLGDVRDSSLRLSQLVQNVLVLARMGHLTEEEMEPVLVRRTVEDVCEQFRRRHPLRPVEVAIQAPEAIVMGSQLYLEQVLGNLLSNADKYSPPGKPIEVTVRAAAVQLLLSVRDHGDGLSDEDRDRVFEPYYRGREARRRATGFGLGLAVCKGLVEAIDGRLSFVDAEAGGAEFVVELPLVDIEGVAARFEEAASVGTTGC